MSHIKLRTQLAAVLLGAMAVSACNNTDKSSNTTADSNSSLPDDKVVAIVNGTPIGEQLLDAYSQQRNASLPHQRDKVDRTQILQELINFELVIQDAKRKEIDKIPDVATELKLQRRNVLASAAFREYVRNNPLTDEQMRSDYESRMSQLSLREYKLRHILTSEKEAADKIISELADGKQDFSAVAKKHSTGPSAEQGGDLGWLSPHDMLPEFKVAVESLQKGQFTPTPVQTRFGWHVVYVEDIRETPPPAYEQVRDRVAEVLKRHQIEDYIASLRKTASIEMRLEEQPKPAAEAKPLSGTPSSDGSQVDDTLKGYQDYPPVRQKPE